MLWFILVLSIQASSGIHRCLDPDEAARAQSPKCLRGQVLFMNFCRSCWEISETCLSYDFPNETPPSCKEYDARGVYEAIKQCAEVTDGIPHTGFLENGGRTIRYPVIVPASVGGQCPNDYCPTNDAQCIIRGHNITEFGGTFGVFEAADQTVTFNHGNNQKATNADNFREHLLNSQKIG